MPSAASRTRSSSESRSCTVSSPRRTSCQRAVIPAIVGADEQRVARANSLVEGATNLTNSSARPSQASSSPSSAPRTSCGSTRCRTSRRSSSSARSSGSSARCGRATSRAACGRHRLHQRRPVRPPSDRDAASFRRRVPARLRLVPGDRISRLPPQPAGRRAADRGLRRRQCGRVVRHLRRVARVKATTLGIAACMGLGLPFWLLVPHVPLAVMVAAMAIVGFANPMATRAHLQDLTTRVPPAVFPQVVQTIIVSNQVVRPAAYATAGVLFSSLGLHTVYAIAAVLATVASSNYILAILAEGPGLAQEQPDLSARLGALAERDFRPRLLLDDDLGRRRRRCRHRARLRSAPHLAQLGERRRRGPRVPAGRSGRCDACGGCPGRSAATAPRPRRRRLDSGRRAGGGCNAPVHRVGRQWRCSPCSRSSTGWPTASRSPRRKA